MGTKPFTFEERKQIEELIKTPLSLSKIGVKIGRSKNGVIAEVRNNGGRANYSAEQAERNKAERLRIGHKKTGEKLSVDGPYLNLKAEIKALQMQIDILFELTKQKGKL